MINQGEKSPKERRRSGGFETGELPIPSVRDVLRVAFRHKYLVLAMFVLAGFVGAGVSLLLPEVWESEGRILLSDERGSLRINPAAEGMVTAAQDFGRTGADAELAILTSQSLAEEVVQKVGLDRVLDLKEGETLAELFKDDPNAEVAALRAATKKMLANAIMEPQGGVIWCVYRHSDPWTARDVLHTWMNSYVDRHIQVHSSSAKPELIQQQLDERKDDLDKKETELNDFLVAHNVAAVTQELETTGMQVSGLEERLRESRAQIEAEKARIAVLEEALRGRGDADIRPMEMENPDWTVLDEQLRELDIEKRRLESRYVNHPDLRAVNIEIEKTKEARSKLPRTIPRTLGAAGDVDSLDPALQLQASQVNLSGLQATETALTAQLEPLQARLAKLREVEPMAIRLEREVAAARDLYEAARNSLVLAQTSQGLDASKVSNVRIVDPATLPDERTSPRRKRMTAMAAFAGLVFGLGLAFVREFFDATIKSRDEAEKKLGITVLAVVPQREFKKCI